MTDLQKETIRAMRLQDISYVKIGEGLGLSDNTVRSYCRRNSLGEKVKNSVACRQCGKPVKIVLKQKPRLFCSDACRSAWWNSHPDCVNRKAVYGYTCAHCGRSFTAYKRTTHKDRHFLSCTTYEKQGKSACAAKRIPEEKLVSLTCEILKIDKLDSDTLRSRITAIRIEQNNTVVFILNNGSEIKKQWKDRSRSESWTDEMKEAARQKALERSKHNA